MSHYYTLPLFDAAELTEARRVTGPGFARIVHYFHEDGVKAIVAIEHAMHVQSATAMVLPAHTLKGEARQLGAVRLGEIAEAIEMRARDCIEKRIPPQDIAVEVSMLRGCFAETLQHLDPAPANGAPSAPPALATSSATKLRRTARRPAIFGRRT